MRKEVNYADGELVELAKQEPEFFGLLMERYQAPLLRYVRRLTQLSPEDAEDLLQEIFIKIYQNLNEYDEVLKFSSWAYRITHNHIIDYFRRISARPRTSILEEYEWEKIVQPGVNLEKKLITQECIEKIKECIQQLPLKYREVLILRFMEELEYEEIMDILKKPKGTVATLIARGREKLFADLKEKNINCF